MVFGQMNLNIYKLLISAALGFLLFVPPLSAQQYAFKELGLAEGLPANQINVMLQDASGFYWFGSEGAGLLRYDGYEIVSVSRELDKPHLFIYSLAEDEAGNLWLGTEDGLVRYDGLTFTSFASMEQVSSTQSIVFHKGRLLTISRQGRIFELSGDSLELVFRQAGTDKLVEWGGQLIAAGEAGLFVVNQNVQQLDSQVVLDVYVDVDELYISRSNGVFKGVAGQNVNRFGKVCNTGLLDLIANENQLWGTDGESLYQSDGQNITQISASEGLAKQRYDAVYVDIYGTKWAIGEKRLLQLANTGSALWPTPDRIKLSATATFRNRAVAASSNKLWKLTSNQDSLIAVSSPSFGTVQALQAYEGLLFLATERGLYTYNGQTFSRIPIRGLFSSFIFSLAATEEGLWIGTGQGLYRYKRGSVYNEQERNGLPASTVYAISAAPDGALWCATYFDGFYRRYKGEWQLHADRELDVRIDSLQVNAFAAESHEALWIATASQALVRTSVNGKVRLSSDRLNFAELGSLRYLNNHLWAGSSKGVFEIYPNLNQSNGYFIKSLGREEGVFKAAVNAGALYVEDNKLLAGSSLGLQLIDLDHAREEPLRLRLTKLELFFGDVENVGAYGQGLLPFSYLPMQLELPYDLNFINVKLSGLNPLRSDALQYRYRLKESGQGEWTNAGTRREAIFSNLSPGRYTFEAQTSADGLRWSSPPLKYNFTIATPYYRSWWFIGLLVLAAGALVYVFVNERLKRINQKLVMENKLINMERKALRLQMNPHFIFNALDSISSFIFKKDPKMAVRYLNNFAKLMRLTLESSMEHVHAVETEVSILKNYLELEQLRFQNKFDYLITVDDEIDYDIGIPPMLIQPHVENAILHGIKPKETDGKIEIRFLLNDDFLICEIEDDGIGRKAAKELGNRKQHRSMATRINRDRIRLLKEALHDDIYIDIIDKFDHGEQAAGTLVRIRLLAENI
jgi:ligand-binding sensor domain-containing protein